jgi:hypothetical protein
MLRGYDEVAWTRLIWLRIESRMGLLGTWQLTFGFRTMLGYAPVVGQPAAAPGGLSSRELVSRLDPRHKDKRISDCAVTLATVIPTFASLFSKCHMFGSAYSQQHSSTWAPNTDLPLTQAINITDSACVESSIGLSSNLISIKDTALCASMKEVIFLAFQNTHCVRFQVLTAVTTKNAVFWDIKTQFVPHSRHITSPLQSPAS